MNVAIIGSQKVGKTTLYKKIIESLPESFFYFDEMPDELVPEANSFFSFMCGQEKILLEHIKRIEFEKKHELVSDLSDGSLIDTMAYMIVGRESPYTYAVSDDTESSVNLIKILTPAMREAMSYLHSYDLLFYIPIEFDCENSTKKDLLYRWTIDNTINRILKSNHIRHHTITGSVEERRDLVLGLIKDYELKNQSYDKGEKQ